MGQQKSGTPIIIIIAIIIVGAGIDGYITLLRLKQPQVIPLKLIETQKDERPKNEKDKKEAIKQKSAENENEKKYEIKAAPSSEPTKIPQEIQIPKTTPKAEPEIVKNGSLRLPILSENYTPSNLKLPFELSDMAHNTEGLVSPFGIIRHSRDEPRYGHSGIDIPLPNSASFYAVADGLIHSYKIEDEQGGYYLGLLITEGTRQGEGWRFLYEHVYLVPGLSVGSRVKKGDLIAHNALLQNHNNHLGLENLFNNYQYTRNHKCWIDFLQESDRKTFLDKFNQFAVTQKFIDQWMNASEEGKYQMRDLLNKVKFPSGPQPCYLPGTDARIN